MHITYEYQSTNYILITSNDKQPRVSLSKAEKGLVISEGWENEHNVIEPTTEGKTELVHEELRLPLVGRPHDERVEQNLFGVHFSQ